jgi:hypothetical protein
MSIHVLIADKSVPFASSLAGALRAKDVSVALLGDSPDNKSGKPVATVEGSALVEIPWNRSSSLSAHTCMRAVRNSMTSVDQAVLFFDTPTFAQLFQHGDASHTTRIVDDYIRGYLILVNELSGYFADQKKGRIIFALQSRNPETQEVQNTALAVAESAFIRLAEETSVSFLSRQTNSLQTLLVRLESAGEADPVDWLAGQILQPSPARGQTRWVKAGARGLFGKL